ncbi:LacI family DNA-binding transcriptional regulator [Vibrio sp. LaRot3]|uniref:LacI family DNA-binding transcriptional regulator n=1 Tax=Vibrio sp. LaRot3 TaxID=2998829 RepID=UPI0022CDF831|nr:LacI family DNA-binding transcriptional regulator [Vibrio sp. LaRot3]MDA0147744.1 LacI family DNA-binding transcriptional regulator [Vibrio sp. LaRot3]
MATINDVCRVAGVSKATVSRVINGTGQVRASTREKVEAVMKELNYRPSIVAQALANKSANSIGLVISDFTGGYFGNLLKQASVSAEKMGKQLLFADGHNNAEDELKAVHSLVEKRCDIIILYSRMLSCEQVIALSKSIDVPLLNVGRLLPESAGYSISFDQKNAIQIAAKHLVDLGHKNLTYMGPKPTTPTSRMRLAGFLEYVEQHEEQGLVNQICESNFGFEEGYKATKKWLESNHFGSAIIAAADDIAVGCIKALKEHGILVPQHVSIVSIDNDACSPFIDPPLTTVDVPIREVTDRAMAVAQEILSGAPQPDPEVIYGQLIERASTRSLWE